MSKITDVGAHYDPQFERVDTPRTDAVSVSRYFIEIERELAGAVEKERERCALVCERKIDAPAGTYQILMTAAKEIRKGE